MGNMVGGSGTRKQILFLYNRLDEDGTANAFETDQDKATEPTLLLNTTTTPSTLKKGILKRVHYRLNPTNAETYTLRIWSGADADDYASNLKLLYESPAAQVDDEDYDEEVNVPFVLAATGWIYFSIDWTGAPGNCPGFIEVSGEGFE